MTCLEYSVVKGLSWGRGRRCSDTWQTFLLIDDKSSESQNCTKLSNGQSSRRSSRMLSGCDSTTVHAHRVTPNSPTLQVHSIHRVDSTGIFQIFPASKNGDVSSFFYKIQYKKIQKSKTSSDIKKHDRQAEKQTDRQTERQTDRQRDLCVLGARVWHRQ